MNSTLTKILPSLESSEGSRIRDLIKKYDVPGPRYTSYPPATHFSEEFGAEDHAQEIRAHERSATDSPISIYFHIPFCDSLCYFCGCSTIITHDQDTIAQYVQYLRREIDLLVPLLNSNRRVVQMHWGGGTPSYLPPKLIYELGQSIQSSFPYSDDPEISVEIDPRELTYEHLVALRAIGCNRISMGVQDFDPQVQRAVNRNQSEECTRTAIEWIRKLGFASFNIDLIYGLPFQTVQSFGRTLEKIIEIAPDRIAAYNFAYVPWLKKHQRVINPLDLPPGETKVDLLLTTIDKLTGAGYAYIGMDHFALPEDELAVAHRSGTLRRNFQGYSTHAGSDLYALGMTAVSHFGSVYAQNAKGLPAYYGALRSGMLPTSGGYRMTLDDTVRKDVIMSLMCDLVVEKEQVEKRFGVDFDDYFAQSLVQLQPLAVDGLVVPENQRVVVTDLGRLFVRNIAMCFDAYLSTQPADTPVYSRTV